MEAVIVAKEGRVGVCIDICLEMSSGIETPPEGQRQSSEGNQSPLEAATNKEADLLGLEGANGVGGLNIEDNDGAMDQRHGEQINLME